MLEISRIFDYKAENDFANEEMQRPRVHMGKAIRSYMTKTHVQHTAVSLTVVEVVRMCQTWAASTSAHTPS
jgi:hypothetical protein